MDLEITPDRFMQQAIVKQDFKNICRRKYKTREPVTTDQMCGGCINCWGKPIGRNLRFGVGICHNERSKKYHKQVAASDWCKYYEGGMD